MAASSKKPLTARQKAALARHDRMVELARAAAPPDPTPQEMQRLRDELARARDATAEMAEKYQHLQIAYSRLRDLKVCADCSQPNRKQVSA